LFTDVFRSRPLLCTIQLQSNFALPRAEKGEAARRVLDFEHQRKLPEQRQRRRVGASAESPTMLLTSGLQ
jgi:hypothetical protein